MKELIKEAESLYLELSRITGSLVYARLHDDNDLLHGCRNELENYAQSVMQTLKCLVDRKDNFKIINFRNLWKEQPDKGKEVLVFVKGYKPIIYRRFDEKYFRGCQEVLWIYTDEILPKGGEAWNTTK